jgi:enoyl-[acyl-carrier protein] reductase III
MAIVVAGGTKGIGLATAKAFAGPGEKVFLNYFGDDGAARDAKAAIEKLGAECHVIKADAGTAEGCKALYEAVRAHTDRIDQVVHCCVTAYGEPALEADPVRFAKAVETNGISLLYLVQAMLPLMDRGSTAFFLSSRGSKVVVPNYASIGVAKSLAESLVRYLAVELAPRGIRINVVSPAIVDTGAVRSLFGDQTDQMMKAAAEANPSGRGVKDSDYTNVIKWLASPEAEYIQGQVIAVNGGANLMG